MPAKVSKKVKPKRKQVKKTIKRKVQQNHNPYNTSTEQNVANNLRQQLLARGLFGYNPQQYGNINNQRRIDQIKQDNQTIAQEINDYKATIDSLKKEKDEYKKKAADAKKTLKAKEQEKDRAKTEVEMASDKLQEQSRIDNEMQRLKQKQEIINQQLAEKNSENKILESKANIDTAEAELNKAKLVNIQRKRMLEENNLYQHLQQVKAEHLITLNENNAMAEAMKSQEFLNPTKELTNTVKALEAEKARRKLLEEHRRKLEEYQLLKLQQDSMPDDKAIEALSKQAAEQINATAEKIRSTKELMYPHQQKMNQYNADLAKREELDNNYYKLQSDNKYLQAQSAKLTDAVRKPINTYNKAKMGVVAQQQINNDTIKRRIDYSNRALGLREENAILDEKYAQLKNTDIPEEEAAALGQAEAVNEVNKEKVQTLRDKRKADFELAKANAKKAYQESPEFNSMINNLVDIEKKAQNMAAQTHQLDLMNKAAEQEQKAELAFQLASGGIKNDLPSLQQVELVENQLKEELSNLSENAKIVQEIFALKRQFPARWAEFIQANPGADIPASQDALNRPKQDLLDILNGFKGYLQKNPPEESVQETNQVMQPSLGKLMDISNSQEEPNQSENSD